MKIIIVGGHLAPALGVIDELDSKDSVVFIGRKNALEGESTVSLEYQEITKRNIPFLPLSAGRFQRSFSSQTLPSFARMPKGLVQALGYLRKEKPDVVLTFGGYLSVPVGIGAKMLGIPLVIHEQTLEVGLANKILSSFATKICISWEVSRSYFPSEKVVLTGNPLKKFPQSNVRLPFSKSDDNLPMLYITGGSTGSHAINELVRDCLDELTNSFRILHQTGDAKEFRDFDTLQTKKDALTDQQRKRYSVQKYIPSEDIGGILSASDIVMSRSGINTISELIYFGKPALLIPLPHGQKGEQLKNARFLEKLGLARVIPQENATSQVIVTTLLDMSSKLELYTKEVKTAQKELQTNASKKIGDILSYVVSKKNS